MDYLPVGLIVKIGSISSENTPVTCDACFPANLKDGEGGGEVTRLLRPNSIAE
jgi:hypothetical protein